MRTSRTPRGLATAAARLRARWGLAELGIQRIEIVAAVGNTASRRVAAKVGALAEGITRGRLRVQERPLDALCYSLIHEDLGLVPTEPRPERYPCGEGAVRVAAGRGPE